MIYKLVSFLIQRIAASEAVSSVDLVSGLTVSGTYWLHPRTVVVTVVCNKDGSLAQKDGVAFVVISVMEGYFCDISSWIRILSFSVCYLVFVCYFLKHGGVHVFYLVRVWGGHLVQKIFCTYPYAYECMYLGNEVCMYIRPFWFVILFFPNI